MFALLVKPLSDLLTSGLGIVGDHFKDKRALKKAKSDSERRVVEAKTNHVINMAEKLQAHEIDWDIAMAKASDKSWKDEWFTILLSIPAVLCFIPGFDVYVFNGFQALQQAPEWYLIAFGTAVAASFGMRNIVPHFKKSA